MKIFISSVIRGMGEFRTAAARAVRNLGHQPIMAEDFGAEADSPQKVCLRGVITADAVIAIVGAKYGDTQSSGLSATHEEVKEAKLRGCPMLTMVQSGVSREPAQAGLLTELQDWSTGTFTTDFVSADDLLDKLSGALHNLDLTRATGPADPAEMLQRALSAFSETERHHSNGPYLQVSLACGPHQNIMRPAHIESEEFAEKVQRAALFGKGAMLSIKQGTEIEYRADTLALTQKDRSLVISESASIAFATQLLRASGLSAIIEEDVQEIIHRFLEFSAILLEDIDPVHRLTHVTIAANISDASHSAWRTREEHSRSPNSMQMRMNSAESEPAYLAPPRTRSALKLEAAAQASDLTVKLRRQFRDGGRR
ncbi:MAG: DUF4062 domain-containing protein [Rhodospirillaceae bacterium]